jgi:hypothetical protein
MLFLFQRYLIRPVPTRFYYTESLGQAAKAFQVFPLIRRGILVLGLPKCLCKAFDHLVFAYVGITSLCGQRFMNPGDASRAIGGNLFADAEVQSHVKERIRLPAVRDVITIEVFARDVAVIFGVPFDDRRYLCFQRGHRKFLAMLLPGIGVHLAELVAILTEYQESSFLVYSHQQRIGHSAHMGFLALQT